MRHWAAVLACILATAALAGDGIDLGSVAGVYKHRFHNGLVDGTNFESEDVLEIVQLDPKTAYVRTHLEFYNGHICSLNVVGRVEHGEIVMHPSTGDDAKPTCELRLVVKSGKIAFKDVGDCRASNCGVRGSFDGTSFPLSAKRTIRYMTRLKTSQQYRDALAEAGIKP